MLTHYLRTKTAHLQAIIWLEMDGISRVVEAMYHLNHHARRNPAERENIYALKYKLIHWLYCNGYCSQVTTKLQLKPCWACDATGRKAFDDYEAEPCLCCGGLGVVHILGPLYQFVFIVNARPYVWHQPAHLVWWQVEPRGETGIYEPDTANTEPLHRDTVQTYHHLVKLFLQRQGIDVTDGEIPF